MAQYKVIQDIEAEDKLVGPLTLRQFIYAGIVIVLGFVAFQLGRVSIVLWAPFIPPMIFFAALAAPLGGAQSTEVWLLAKIRFLLKPRKRIWNQDGMQQLVTITAPKKIEKQLTDNLSKTEVKSRLSALASTLDSRGWAIKGAMSSQGGIPGVSGDDERLFDLSSIQQGDNPAGSVPDAIDIMDEENSQVAQVFNSMLQKSDEVHRESVLAKVRQPVQATQNADYWFLNGQAQAAPGQQTFKPKTVTPGAELHTAADDHGQNEQAFLQKRHKEQVSPNPYNTHLKTLRPLSEQKRAPHPVSTTTQPTKASTTTPNPDILRLANNNDLNVSTIAREAKRTSGDLGDDEVVVSLH